MSWDVSSLSLLVASVALYVAHFRTVDSLHATPVSIEGSGENVRVLFHVQNGGTRPAAIHEVQLRIPLPHSGPGEKWQTLRSNDEPEGGEAVPVEVPPGMVRFVEARGVLTSTFRSSVLVAWNAADERRDRDPVTSEVRVPLHVSMKVADGVGILRSLDAEVGVLGLKPGDISRRTIKSGLIDLLQGRRIKRQGTVTVGTTPTVMNPKEE